jgi:hypothetical protein
MVRLGRRLGGGRRRRHRLFRPGRVFNAVYKMHDRARSSSKLEPHIHTHSRRSISVQANKKKVGPR